MKPQKCILIDSATNTMPPLEFNFIRWNANDKLVIVLVPTLISSSSNMSRLASLCDAILFSYKINWLSVAVASIDLSLSVSIIPSMPVRWLSVPLLIRMLLSAMLPFRLHMWVWEEHTCNVEHFTLQTVLHSAIDLGKPIDTESPNLISIILRSTLPDSSFGIVVTWSVLDRDQRP